MAKLDVFMTERYAYHQPSRIDGIQASNSWTGPCSDGALSPYVRVVPKLRVLTGTERRRYNSKSLGEFKLR